MEYFIIGKELDKREIYDDVKQVIFQFIGNNWDKTPELDLIDEFDDLQPEELLPHDTEEDDEWSRINPKGTGSYELKAFMEAGMPENYIWTDTTSRNLQPMSADDICFDF